MQPHPSAVRLGDLTQRADQLQHPRLHGLAVPETSAVLDVDAIGRRVLADHQQFFHATFEQGLGFAQHIADRPGHEVAAHRRDDAERTAMIAAFADLEVGVVARRELETGDAERIGHEIDERVVRLRQIGMDRIHHLLRGVGTGHGQHARVHLANQIAATVAALGSETSGDDHTAVGGQRFTDGVEAFAHGVVDEAAGVDDHQIGTFEGFGGLVALGAQARKDQFGIGKGLGAAQAHETHLGGGRHRGSFGGDNFTHICLLSPLMSPSGRHVFQGRLIPKASSTCSVFFCICSCIFISTVFDWST